MNLSIFRISFAGKLSGIHNRVIAIASLLSETASAVGVMRTKLLMALVLGALALAGCRSGEGEQAQQRSGKQDAASLVPTTENDDASAFGQTQTRDDCDTKIREMREIYIVILRKTPAMPPLAKLSPGIQSAINEAEIRMNNGAFEDCVSEMQRQIDIVKGYAQ